MSKISFKINGNDYCICSGSGYGPDFTLNEFIRNVAGHRGTKAMCHEGGCGVCIVAVTAVLPSTNEMKTFSVNSCLVSILSCHGWQILTTEGIGNRMKGYHETQARLAKFNGTQCGFCTPGWVMSMYSLLESKGKQLTMKEIENSFAGNICRCTGYRPIADAFKSFAIDANKNLTDKLIDLEDLSMFNICGNTCKNKCHNGQCRKSKQVEYEDDWSLVENVEETMIVIENGCNKWFKAYSLDHVFKAMNCGDYKLIAGNTGQGVYHVTNYPANVIDIFNVSELKGHYLDENLILNAGMPLTEMMEVFQKISQVNEDFLYLKQFYDHMDLVAHIPVKNIGTIGGNLFLKYTNNDFPSDLFLLFETVGAMLTIVGSNRKTNTVSLPIFLQMDMQRKLILNVILPPLSHCCLIKTFKIMPRSQNAHAIVNMGLLLRFQQNSKVLAKASIVYGGITPKFIHASKAEAVLANKDPFDNKTLQLALKVLFDELNPQEFPTEPSAKFRKMLAVNLFYKAILSLCPNDKLEPKYRSGGEAIKRQVSKGTQIFDSDKSMWPLNKPIPKIEALVQCSGEATFSNDLPRMDNELFAAFVTADVKAGSMINGFDTTEAFKLPGVSLFLTAKDIPGDNVFTPTNMPFMTSPEEILCSGEVKFFGQPAALIVADREKTAAKAASLVKIKYSLISTDKPLINIDDVLRSNQKSKRTQRDKIVKPTEIGSDVTHKTVGDLKLESQYPFHMETQVCVVLPTEEGLEIYLATQWIELATVAIAQSLKIPVNSITMIVRRVGGGYGAKITRSSQIACSAALVTHLTGKPCRFILPLETNMHSIGKRLPTVCNFEVKTNNLGEIQSLTNRFYQDCGSTFNEIMTPVTVMHLPNCYKSNRWFIEANRLEKADYWCGADNWCPYPSVRTDTASNTWVRSPSSLEGVAMTEYMMEKIAYELKIDPIKVRKQNIADDNPILSMIDQVMVDSKYLERVGAVKLFNDQNRWRKRAIKLIPLSFDIIYFGNFNSVVSIYHTDGTVTVTHGGIEMGQGINTKTAQVCAFMLGVPVEKVNIKPSNNVTSPNTMVTGSSMGSDCVAFATAKACQILMNRLKPIRDKNINATWQEIVQNAYEAGIDLQATYMFSTNDGVKGYDVYAVCVLEVEVDILTGNHELLRVDILEDVGRSISPEIDVGQIEGSFIMGLGYWTSEHLIYDENSGQLLTDRTWTYKPPGLKDIPADMRIYFRPTGEPALCLATSVLHALREAVQAARLDAGYPDQWIDIGIPCTVENIFMAVKHKLSEFKLK